MILFDPSYAPERKQAFGVLAGLALLAAVLAALVWTGVLDQDNSVTWVWPRH